MLLSLSKQIEYPKSSPLYPGIFEPALFTAGRSGWKCHGDRTVDSRDIYLSAEHCLGDIDGDIHEQVISFSFECLMGLNCQIDVETARGAAICACPAHSLELHFIAGVGPCRDLYLNGAGSKCASVAAAGCACLCGGFSGSAALGAGLSKVKKSSALSDGAGAFAVWTCLI